MKLLYELTKEQMELLGLGESETVEYAIPLDLAYNHKLHQAEDAFAGESEFLVVTHEHLYVLSGNEVAKKVMLADCSEVRCEAQIYSGILTVTYKTGEKECVARFTMREMVRVSYVARGADIFAKGQNEKVTSLEYEKYCERCGRALPGTSKCPYCDGKRVILRKFWDLCQGFQWKLLLISCFMVIGSALAVYMPVVQQQFIDNVLADKRGGTCEILIFVGTMLTIVALRTVIEVIRYWWCVSLGAQISLNLRAKMYYKIQVLSLSFLNRRKPGELMNRVAGDTRQIRQFMEEVFGDMVATLATMIASFAMMLYLSPKMTLYSTGLIVAVFVLTRVFWHKIHTIFHKQWLKNDKMRNGLSDIISGMRVVKAFGKEKEETKRFEDLANDFAATQKKNETFWAIFYPCLTFIMGIGSYVAIYFGGLSVLEGDMTTGQLIQFVTYTGFLYGPLGWMTHLPRSIMQMLTSLNRIYDVLDEPPAITDKEQAIVHEIEGNIEFSDVSFGYHSYEPVLEHISFDIKKGEMIGLVGASGTGKTTLINLLMRLYDVDGGCIKVDGHDIRSLKGESLHSQIGVVLQETFLFSGSILNNIRFAKQDATYEEVIRAAKAANAHDFICKTPDGYNTYVGEHGYNLSGGERQRIAIARAILNDPKLLILDEATSALDTESEYMIQQALERLIAGRTTVAIAHRLSTLRNADRLVVLDGHHIAEIGTHNELMEKKGIYYGLVMAQLEMAKQTKV